MNKTRNILDKIPEAELQSALDQPHSDPVNVMVAVDVPVPRIELRPSDGREPGSRSYTGISDIPSPSADDLRVIQERSRELGDLIRNVTGQEPHFLSGSHAFVVDATGQQLRDLAHSPLVRQIRLNRRLR